MNKNSFHYCLLKYVHSPILGEMVNIGIFFQFPDGKFYFKYPENFDRIKGLYDDFNEYQLKQNLEGLKEMIAHINKYRNHENKDLSNLFTKDATVLQVGNVSHSLLYSDNYNTVINNFYNLYFEQK